MLADHHQYHEQASYLSIQLKSRTPASTSSQTKPKTSQVQHRQHGVRKCCEPTISREQTLTATSKEKIHINVVVIGHVDSGKSTTTGRKHLPFRDAARLLGSHHDRLDLQVRWYRQAYDREVREGKHIHTRSATGRNNLLSPTFVGWKGNFGGVRRGSALGVLAGMDVDRQSITSICLYYSGITTIISLRILLLT